MYTRMYACVRKKISLIGQHAPCPLRLHMALFCVYGQNVFETKIINISPAYACNYYSFHYTYYIYVTVLCFHIICINIMILM